MARTTVRSTMAGDFAQPTDCIEVASDKISTTLAGLAEQAKAMEDAGAVIMGIQFYEMPDAPKALALMWVAEAPTRTEDLSHLESMLARLESVGGDSRRVTDLEERVAKLERRKRAS